MDVVDEVPVAGRGLGAEAVDVDGGAHGPGVLVEREVFVDDADLVAVALGEGGEDGFMEAGAVGALEVVEADDDDGSGGGAAAGGPAVGGDEGARVGGEVVSGELREALAVFGEQEVDGFGGLAFGAEGDGDVVVAGDLGGLARAEGDGGPGREIGLLAEEDLDAVLLGGCEGGAGGWRLRVAAEGGEGQGEEGRSEGGRKKRTNSLSQEGGRRCRSVG